MRGEVLILIIALQRLAELALARRNTSRLLLIGAVERGADHYPALVALHAAWLGTVAVLAAGQTIAWGWVLAYMALQALRVWTIHSLNGRWTTRILVLPGQAAVTGGPYRYLRHPNYVIVALELALVPLALGAPGVALIFTLANAALMQIRLRTEEAALTWATARPGAKA